MGKFNVILYIGDHTSVTASIAISMAGITNQSQHHPHPTIEEAEVERRAQGSTKLGSSRARTGIHNQSR